MTKVSAVLITYNSEQVILPTLEALAWCDEIVVVDSGSTDQTLAICESKNCNITHRAFTGYGEQKRFAVALAQNDWVLSVDADEVLSPAIAREIQQAIAQDQGAYAGYYLPISLVFLGSRINSEHKKLFLRLFNRMYGSFDTSSVHEKVQLTGKTRNLKHEILHYSYHSIENYFQKFNSYTSLAAANYRNRGRKKSALAIVLRFHFVFIRSYFIKGCFLNGFPGFIWSLFSALYAVVKFTKLWEMNNVLPTTPVPHPQTVAAWK